ncbi:mechanosensitive ion channel family protein [Nocardioides mesophilus]|uniref:Mechanosensitive ion channel family protein n=1 Tax=Nocardioides mesophilus TaxID=433659 RepID=A0A7G9RCT8_9ACTN|nr:mechanosensitive ion channel family protein [Nocardioides mesophilus]QNN53413.1 mechanosensitive ion channel family protein [Nocardioides mesophilus]
MPFLDVKPACEQTDGWCLWVEEQTHNIWLAKASDWLVVKPLVLLSLLVIALVVRWLVHRLIDRLAQRAAEGLPSPVLRHRGTGSAETTVAPAMVSGRRVQRAETMGSLLKSIASIVIFTITAITAIAEVGYPVGPLIASAGIVGVALGFGAQSLVKDFLSGIFMIFEDQYGVGDVVDLGEAVGTVEAVGLRVSRLRDVEGTVWYVRNGEILRVGNQSQNWARTVIDVPVSHEEDLYRVQDVLREVAHGVWEDEEFKPVIIEEPEVWGVQEMTPDWITVRVTLKTAPLEQWAVARELRERIKARFDVEGIELARPARVLIHREQRAHATLAATGPDVATGSTEG